jgi:hypothetical protein
MENKRPKNNKLWKPEYRDPEPQIEARGREIVE